MIVYNGKAKCSCGQRGKWKVMNGTQSLFACHIHKNRLIRFSDPKPDDKPLTEADRQTWAAGID